jgi:hypothetical protein
VREFVFFQVVPFSSLHEMGFILGQTAARLQPRRARAALSTGPGFW